MANQAKHSKSFFLLLILAISTLSTLFAAAKPIGDKYVRHACSVTRYRSLCARSLAPFSSAARDSPSRWARAGVSVTITEAKSVARYLAELNRTHSSRMSRRSKAALSDCMECFDSAVDELHKSLGVLRSLTKRAFEGQMGDLATWLSAAMTDADTCLDGFQGLNGTTSRQVRVLRSRVSRASCVMSNALALVNKLASSGFRASDHP